MTETEYLKRQADDAKAAALGTVREIGSGLSSSVDVRAWTTEHPLAALSTAAATGFAAAALVMPARRHGAKPVMPAAEQPADAPGRAPLQAAPPVPKFSQLLLREVAKTLIALGFSLITARMGQGAESPNGSEARTDATPGTNDPS